MKEIIIASISGVTLAAIFYTYKKNKKYGHTVEVDNSECTAKKNIEVLDDVLINPEMIKQISRFTGNDEILEKFAQFKVLSRIKIGGAVALFNKAEKELQIVSISVEFNSGSDIEALLDHLEHAARTAKKKVRFYCASSDHFRRILIKKRGYHKTGNKCELVLSF